MESVFHLFKVVTCVHVCTYVCMCECMYVRMYVNMYVCTYVCKICMYVCMYFSCSARTKVMLLKPGADMKYRIKLIHCFISIMKVRRD